ncbi:RDD family protein [Zunongwangia sp.]|uniref:RDD family protein n=1 Tax=Zunongwangia sp. TaxID=1965325 RepID=UPI003AA99241
MDNFQIETAQNINIEQKAAPLLDRIVAYVIDAIIMFFYILIITLLMSGMGVDGFASVSIMMLLILPIFLYFLLFETFMNGQTLGKAAMKLRVVNLDGSRPNFSSYLIRWLLRFIDISMSSGAVAIVSILVGGRGQRLGDMAAKTTVISEKRKVNLRSNLLADLPENYTPKYSQVTLLTDKDIQEVKQIYFRAKRKGNHGIIIALADKVASLLGLSEYEEKPIVFLQRVIDDYNYYTQ